MTDEPRPVGRFRCAILNEDGSLHPYSYGVLSTEGEPAMSKSDMILDREEQHAPRHRLRDLLLGPIHTCGVCGRESRTLLGWVDTPDGGRAWGCSMEHLQEMLTRSTDADADA